MKYLNSIYLMQAADFLKRYGIRSVMNKVPEYLMTTRGYQAWRKAHAPSRDELTAQQLSFLQEKETQGWSEKPMFSILVPAFRTDKIHLQQMVDSVRNQTFGSWELCIADGSPKPSDVEEFFVRYAAARKLPVISSTIPAPENPVSSDETDPTNDAPPINEAIPANDAVPANGTASAREGAPAREASPATSSILTFTLGNEACNRVFFASIDNMGIAGNTNAALAMATGEFIVLLDHDDLLSPDALYELASAIRKDPGIDVIYTDEDMVSADGTFLHNPNFKPDFSLDLLRSCNYITHLYAVRHSLALEVNGFSAGCDGSQDYDFTLKTTRLARKIRHIPKVLYHWRVHGGSVAADSGNKTYAYDAAVRALSRYYDSCGVKAAVTKDPQPGFYLTDYTITKKPLVSVLMYHCADQLCEEWKHAGIELPCTLEFPRTLSQAHGEYILVLRDILRITPDTLRLLLSNCLREEIGIAAPRILREDNKVAQSGLIYNTGGDILSPFAGEEAVYPGYHCYAVCQHQVSLAGPYCFMTSMENLRRNWPKQRPGNKEPVQSAKGHVIDAAADLQPDPQDKTSPKDIHARMALFCLRTCQDGKLITVIPRAHAILTKKGTQDAALPRSFDLPSLTAPDPFYTPNFSQKRPYRF